MNESVVAFHLGESVVVLVLKWISWTLIWLHWNSLRLGKLDSFWIRLSLKSKMEYGRFCLKHFIYCEGEQALVQIVWRGCEFSVLGVILYTILSNKLWVTLLEQDSWTRWLPEVSSSLNHSVLLWNQMVYFGTPSAIGVSVCKTGLELVGSKTLPKACSMGIQFSIAIVLVHILSVAKCYLLMQT